MVEFAGFEMPLSYSGIIEEHLAVRAAAGLFDLSHMGELQVTGPAALDLLERAFTNSAAILERGQAQYTLACLPDGGVIDDLIVYRLDNGRYLLCVNAANIDADWQWLIGLNNHRAQLSNVSEETALVALQGPLSRSILQRLVKFDTGALKRFYCVDAEVAGVRCLIARTGYTGEDGFELFVGASLGPTLFGTLLGVGHTSGLKPCGLGARDTLRMEAGLPLYGHELDRRTTPLEAGLNAFVRLERDFIGAPALRAQAKEGLPKRLIGLRTEDAKSIARQGYSVLLDARKVGEVTSGTFAPSFNRPLAMAYVSSAYLNADRFEVQVRGHTVAAAKAPLPFYRRPRPSIASHAS